MNRAKQLTELTEKHSVVCAVIDKMHVSFEIIKTKPVLSKIETDLGILYNGITEFYGYVLIKDDNDHNVWCCTVGTPESKAFMSDLVSTDLITKAMITDFEELLENKRMPSLFNEVPSVEYNNNDML